MKNARIALIAIAALAVLALAAPQVNAEGSPRLSKAESGVQATVQEVPTGSHVRAVGTIQYDNDTPFRRLPNTDDCVGNRFNDGVYDPHSIATISFRLAQNYGGGVVASIWDVNTANAQIMRRWYISGIPSGNVTGFLAVVPLTSPVAAHNGSFIGGIHNTFYTGLGCPTDSGLNGTCDGVALSAGTAGASPFHGVYINLAGGAFSPPTATVGTTGQDLGTANALFRVTGDNLPVELMTFSAE
jgi:hypothetical protein